MTTIVITVSCQTVRISVDCFLPHAQQVGLTPRTPFQIAPCPSALLNAVLLWGCHFSVDKSFLALRELFLRRSLAALPELLHQTEGAGWASVVAAIQTATLLSTYFFAHDRVLEGTYHANTASGLVLAAGIHRTRVPSSRSHPSSPLQHPITSDEIDSIMTKSSGQYEMWPSARSRNDAVERLMTFWNAFVLEHSWSAVCFLHNPGTRANDVAHLRASLRGIDEMTNISASWPVEYVVSPIRA